MSSTPIDTESACYWGDWGLEIGVVSAQADEERPPDKRLTAEERAEVVARFYRDNNPHLHKSPMLEALDAYTDAFHAEVKRHVDAVLAEREA